MLGFFSLNFLSLRNFYCTFNCAQCIFDGLLYKMAAFRNVYLEETGIILLPSCFCHILEFENDSNPFLLFLMCFSIECGTSCCLVRCQQIFGRISDLAY